MLWVQMRLAQAEEYSWLETRMSRERLENIEENVVMVENREASCAKQYSSGYHRGVLEMRRVVSVERREVASGRKLNAAYLKIR